MSGKLRESVQCANDFIDPGAATSAVLYNRGVAFSSTGRRSFLLNWHISGGPADKLVSPPNQHGNLVAMATKAGVGLAR